MMYLVIFRCLFCNTTFPFLKGEILNNNLCALPNGQIYLQYVFLNQIVEPSISRMYAIVKTERPVVVNDFINNK